MERCAYAPCNTPIDPSDHWVAPDGRKFCSEACRDDEHIRWQDEQMEAAQ
jgi:hypothetical protein